MDDPDPSRVEGRKRGVTGKGPYGKGDTGTLLEH